MATDGHHDHSGHGAEPTTGLATVVLEVKGLHWATEKAVVENTLRRLDGVRSVEANPVAQTATVSYEPGVTSVAELRRWIEECGYQCAGQSVPGRSSRARLGARRGPGRAGPHGRVPHHRAQGRRAEAAAQVAYRWLGHELGIPLRRIVAIRR